VFVNMARTQHIDLHSGVREVNISLFALNCLELIVLTLLPFAFGAYFMYATKGSGSGSVGGIALMASVLAVLCLTKLAQIRYLRRCPHLLVAHDDLFELVASSVGEHGDPLECRLLEYAGGAEGLDLEPGGGAGAGPPAMQAIEVEGGGDRSDGALVVASAAEHHLVISSMGNVAALVIYVLMIVVALLTESQLTALGFILLRFTTEFSVSHRWVRWRKLQLATTTTTARADELRQSIAETERWLRWQKSLPHHMARWFAFRDGVYGFLVTSVILNVSPADSFDNAATSLGAYLHNASPYVVSYLAIAVCMLSIYTMSYVMTNHLDEMGIRSHSPLPIRAQILRIGLNLPMMMSIALPFLGLLSNELFIVEHRAHDALDITNAWLTWFLLINVSVRPCSKRCLRAYVRVLRTGPEPVNGCSLQTGDTVWAVRAGASL